MVKTISFESENPFFDSEKWINSLNFNRTCDGSDNAPRSQRLSYGQASVLRKLLLDISRLSVRIGGKLVEVGQNLISYIVDVISKCPHTACGVLLIFLLNYMTSHAMFGLRHLQQFLVMTIYPVIIAAGMLMDLADLPAVKDFVHKINSYNREYRL